MRWALREFTQPPTDVRFLADENVPASTVRALTDAGHDVIWVRISAPGSSDNDVLAQAAREGRILLTFDKDFGEHLSVAYLAELGNRMMRRR
jgi:predicted nuclease of predicted toxin-antitoxin system